LAGPILVFVGGMLMAFHPTLLSGFQMAQTDPGDTLFNNYLLEHSWLWLTSTAGTVRFWDPAIGYPTPNVLAYSDLMVSFGPLYWIWRAAGFTPLHSFQLWMLAACALNYWVWYLFLRRAIAWGHLAGAVGAFLFAFGASRLNQLGHQQLLPQFFIIGVLWALLVMFRRRGMEPGDRRTRHRAILAGGICLVGQFYGGFYLGYFTLLILGVAAGVALLMTPHRDWLRGFLRENRQCLVVTGLLAALALAPAVRHWLAAVEAVGPRSVWAAEDMLVRPRSLLFMGANSWFYGWLAHLPWFQHLPMRHEHAIGLGWVTSLLVAWVTWKHRTQPLVRLTVVSVLLLAALLVRLRFPADFAHALGLGCATGLVAARLAWKQRAQPLVRFLVVSAFLMGFLLVWVRYPAYFEVWPLACPLLPGLRDRKSVV